MGSPRSGGQSFQLSRFRIHTCISWFLFLLKVSISPIFFLFLEVLEHLKKFKALYLRDRLSFFYNYFAFQGVLSESCTFCAITGK